MIKQGLDYDPDVSIYGCMSLTIFFRWFLTSLSILQGEYVRLWVLELLHIQKAKIHVPWTLRQGELGAVKIGVDYPNPMVIAQEWNRHLDKTVTGNEIWQNFKKVLFSIERFLSTENVKLGNDIKNETKRPWLLL